ncbi:MAG: ParB/RepB/Spo0J family partition protein [Opitutaceae bacterium]|jgi:uncharacterized ParB-like nuclease family protein
MKHDCKTPAQPLPEGVTMLPIEAVIEEKELQMREHWLDAAHLESLREAIAEGVQLPPAEVYLDDSGGARRWYLADGHHRHMAWRQSGWTAIPCIIMEGGREAARRRALSANAEHTALRRTNADKRKAVMMALQWFPKMSLREMADLCAVTHPLVIKMKKQVVTVTTPNSGKGNLTPGVQQMDWYNDFINTSYRPFEVKFLDVVNAKYWMVESVPPQEKLKTCTQLKGALRNQIHEIEKREGQLKAELIAAKSGRTLPTSLNPEALLGAGEGATE